MTSHRIHIFGAAGSGTTTLGAALAVHLQIRHFDADTYYWLATDPPFTRANDPAVRLQLLQRDLAGLDHWILSGSMCGWGDALIPHLTMAVFLTLPSAVRMARIAERERRRYGDRIAPGGDMRAQHLAFIAWAESYETAQAPTRSRDLHETWLHRLDCPVIRLTSDRSPDELARRMLARLGR